MSTRAVVICLHRRLFVLCELLFAGRCLFLRAVPFHRLRTDNQRKDKKNHDNEKPGNYTLRFNNRHWCCLLLSRTWLFADKLIAIFSLFLGYYPIPSDFLDFFLFLSPSALFSFKHCPELHL